MSERYRSGDPLPLPPEPPAPPEVETIRETTLSPAISAVLWLVLIYLMIVGVFGLIYHLFLIV